MMAVCVCVPDFLTQLNRIITRPKAQNQNLEDSFFSSSIRQWSEGRGWEGVTAIMDVL